MDSKQNKHRRFRALRVFISSLPSCFCVGCQTGTGPPSPKPTAGVWERRRNSRANTVLIPPGGFLPSWEWQHPPLVESPTSLVLLLPLSCPDPVAIHRKIHQKILWALQIGFLNTLHSGDTKHRYIWDFPAPWRPLSPGRAVPVLPLGAPCQRNSHSLHF